MAQGVEDPELLTDRVESLGVSAPLLATRENLPIDDTVAHPCGTLITGPYVLLQFSLPEDTDDFTFDGRVRILRKQKEYPRKMTEGGGTAGIVFDSTFDLSAERGVYSDALSCIDLDVVPLTVYYYTVFYGRTESGHFAFSPAYCHSSNWAYNNGIGEVPWSLDEQGAASPLGSLMYRTAFGRATRWKDEDTNWTTWRLCQVFGRILDAVKDETDFAAKNRSPENCDADLLPYLDHLLGWPTNFELTESLRRIETINVPDLWKTKGTLSALQLAIQTITGWQLSITEGTPWSAHLFSVDEPILDPLAVPADWVEGTDGVWADLCDRPWPAYFDRTNPLHTAGVDTPTGRLPRSFDTARYSDYGLGWRWQTPNGVLIQLQEVEGVSSVITSVVLRKVARLANLLLNHLAAFALEAQTTHIEEPVVDIGDDSIVEVQQDIEETPSVSFLEQVTDSTEDLVLALLWAPGVESVYFDRTDPTTARFRSFHEWLEYV